MSTLNLSPKNPAVLAILLLGGFYLLTRRTASAKTAYGATVGNQSPASKVFLTPVSGAARIAQPAANPLSTLLSLGSQVINTFSPNRVATSTYGTEYYPAALGTGVSAEADGNLGEAAAQEYYSSHADQFIVAPPVFTQDMTDRALLEGMSEY
jgi:hypothetical protein